MGYLHILNLYRPEAQDIFLFKEVYALEKIHGTSAHIGYRNGLPYLFCNEEKFRDRFVNLFNKQELMEKINTLYAHTNTSFTIYGEAYGGKMQGMSSTYGKEFKFIVFDVKIGDRWLSVPQAENFANTLGLDFVYYEKCKADIESLKIQRDADSVQAIRNGMGQGKKREGIVIRPLIELTKNNGGRIIAKYKTDGFIETKTPREVDEGRLRVIEGANAIAEEWVTPMRLQHVLQRVPDHCITKMKDIIMAMIEDVLREGEGEFEPSREVKTAIGRNTAMLYKEMLKKNLEGEENVDS